MPLDSSHGIDNAGTEQGARGCRKLGLIHTVQLAGLDWRHHRVPLAGAVIAAFGQRMLPDQGRRSPAYSSRTESYSN